MQGGIFLAFFLQDILTIPFALFQCLQLDAAVDEWITNLVVGSHLYSRNSALVRDPHEFDG